MASKVQITKGSFYQRNDSTNPASENYIEQVNEIIDNGGTIDPESDLYQNAITQYNNSSKKGQMVRLRIPRGFCGYTDPKTDEFRVIPDPDSSILVPGQVTKELGEYIDYDFSPDLIDYPKDTCLSLGLPGSPTYDKCKETENDPFAVLHDIEWLGTDFDTFADEYFIEYDGGVYGGSAHGCKTPGCGGYWGAPPAGGSVNLSITKAGGGRIEWSWSEPSNWPVKSYSNGDIKGMVYLFRKTSSGNYEGGKLEWFRPGYTGIGTGNLNGYNGHTPISSGTPVKIMLVSVDGSQKTKLADATWG